MRARAARATLARARGAREKTHQPSNDIIFQPYVVLQGSQIKRQVQKIRDLEALNLQIYLL